jgi:hypothetical protein
MYRLRTTDFEKGFNRIGISLFSICRDGEYLPLTRGKRNFLSLRSVALLRHRTAQYLLKVAFEKLFDVVGNTVEAREQCFSVYAQLMKLIPNYFLASSRNDRTRENPPPAKLGGNGRTIGDCNSASL